MPLNNLKHFGRITYKTAFVPDPCIKVRKGAGKSFLKWYFDPATVFEMQRDIVTGKKSRTFSGISKTKSQEICLYAKKRKKR